MNATAFATLSIPAISEVFAPVLEREDWRIEEGFNLETPDETKKFESNFNLVSFLLSQLQEDDKEDIRLSLERELDPRFAVTGVASVEDYASEY